MEGEKMEPHQKGSLKLKCFSPIKILTSPFILGDSLSFFFFFFFFFSFFYAPSLEDLGGFDDIWGENHFLKNLFSNGMTWDGMVIPIDILAVDAYLGMELCTPI
jgi:hypothetical protein